MAGGAFLTPEQLAMMQAAQAQPPAVDDPSQYGLYGTVRPGPMPEAAGAFSMPQEAPAPQQEPPRRMLAGMIDMLNAKRMNGIPLTPEEESAVGASEAYKANVGQPAAASAMQTVGSMAMPLKPSLALALMQGLAPTPAGAQSSGSPRPGTNEELTAEAAAGEAQRAANPSFGRVLMDKLGGLMGGGNEFAPMSREAHREQFMARDPYPKPISEADFVAAAGDRFRQSDGYKRLLELKAVTKANDQAQHAEMIARSEYPKYLARAQADMPKWEDRLSSDYSSHTSDLAAKQSAHNDKSFAERNPVAAGALTYGPLVLGAIAARKAFKGYNQSGDELIEAVKAARLARDPAAELAATRALQSWRNSDYYATVGKTAGKVAGGSIAGRGMMDMTDRYLMPEGSGARENVKGKYTAANIPNLATEYGVNALAGLEAPAIGAMMVKGGPRIAAREHINRLAPGFSDDVTRFAEGKVKNIADAAKLGQSAPAASAASDDALIAAAATRNAPPTSAQTPGPQTLSPVPPVGQSSPVQVAAPPSPPAVVSAQSPSASPVDPAAYLKSRARTRPLPKPDNTALVTPTQRVFEPGVRQEPRSGVYARDLAKDEKVRELAMGIANHKTNKVMGSKLHDALQKSGLYADVSEAQARSVAARFTAELQAATEKSARGLTNRGAKNAMKRDNDNFPKPEDK